MVIVLVQVLVDSLVALAPLALYPEAGSLSIPLAGLLTLFFKGLLELSKSFLDPFGVEGYPGQNIRVAAWSECPLTAAAHAATHRTRGQTDRQTDKTGRQTDRQTIW